MVSRYVTNGPVKQEGICLLPPAHAHYRMMPPQRQDGFHVPTPPYAQQPNQSGNQAQTLRNIAPPGPPNQASTPPTNDLKVQSVPQQQSMNHMYVPPQQPVRNQGPYFRTSQAPPSQPPRMPNQHRGQQQLYQASTNQTQFLSMPMPQMFITANQMQYFSSTQRPPFVNQPIPFGHNLVTAPYTAFTSNPGQTPSVPFPYYSLPRAAHPQPPAATAVQPNPVQQLPTLPLQQAPSQPPTFTRQQHKRRAKAIPIIDPDTGVDKLDEVYEQQNSSHPPSGESSARQTPQPAVHHNSSSKEVQAAFAKQVAQAINSDEPHLEDQDLNTPLDHAEQPAGYHYPPQQPIQPNRLETLIQTSNLKAQAKEFVLSSTNTAKETTPIVSANCDAVEVTLPNKQVKDRESPAKSRKQREQTSAREYKDSVKETPSRDYVGDKDSSNIKSEKPKEPVSVNATPAVPLATTSKDNKEVTPLRDDKKNPKKDAKAESRVFSGGETGEVTNIANSQSIQDSSSAKNKNAAQRAKEVPKQQQQQQQQQMPGPNQKQQAPAPVPQPQPAKANNKSSKKTELNQKGANKEGTDMDAFNDNIRLDTVNANANVAANNDVINANAMPNTNSSINVNINENNKNNSISVVENLPVRPDLRTLPKSKVDVTDIVREKPKIIKPFPVQQQSQDETDKVALTNDKVIQAKNEANSKQPSTENSDSLSEIKSDLPYREDQWTPNNLDGKKVYDKEFLLALRNNPASRKRPDNLPEIIVADERGRLSDGRFSMGGRTDFTNPPFANYGGKSSSQRGTITKRGSQSGKIGGGGGGKGSKNQVIKVSISVREDVKLHETENAWKPARLNKSDNVSDEDKKTAELYKKVRGVLNKLTPQKFETLIGQVQELKIDTQARLQGVIDLVFSKAIDEPSFSVAYANMCRQLALLNVPIESEQNTVENQAEAEVASAAQIVAKSNAKPLTRDGEQQNTVNFRKLLITRCQLEFEKQSKEETARLEKVRAINECLDPEKKKELEDDLENWDRKMRVKSVGNVRFIGELFKQNMLTVNIMQRCMQNLIKYKDEENLECLCKLLTTIGKEIESKNFDLSEYIGTMQGFIDNRSMDISSRVRFMMQDVIDLRRNKWVPRRQDYVPKTIEQIQKDADNEQLNIQAMNSVPITPRREDRGNSAGSSNTDRKRKNLSEDGWQTASRNNRTAATPFTVQSDKLKNKVPLQDEPLGSRQMFGNWSKGSNIKTDPILTSTNTGNMYAALENIDADKRPSSSRGKEPYSSKGPSLERNTYKTYDDRGSRSGSQHRANEGSYPSQRNVPLMATPQPTPVAPRSATPTPPAPAQRQPLTQEQLESLTRNNMDEFVSDTNNFADVNDYIKSNVPLDYIRQMVTDGYLYILERSQIARIRAGLLFARLIKAGTITLDDYIEGLREIINQADDLVIDIPKIWDYISEILIKPICEEVLPLPRLIKCCEILISQGHGANFYAPLFKLIINEKGPNFLLNIWQAAGVSFNDFMPQDEVADFVKANKFEILCGGDMSAGQSKFTYEQIHAKLLEFFDAKTSFDDVVNWITANIGDQVKDTKFVRTLATAVFEDSIQRNKLVSEILQGHCKLLHKYVDNSPTYELQCLYALQALINKLEHPKGLLLSICDRLYEESTFSQESFIAWEISDDPVEQEGKGVALKQLTSFFTQLKENEEEEDYGSSTSEET